jgi:pilus assembly protein CpaB
MSRARLLILLFAIVCAVLAAMLVRGMLGGQPTAMAPSTEPAPVTAGQVLVVARDIAMGEKLAAADLQWRDWPEANIAGTMISRQASPNAVEEFAGSRARLPMILGEPLSAAKIVTAQNGAFMSATLPPGMQGFAIEISDRSAASGFILPNDRVDIILTIHVEEEDGKRKYVVGSPVVTNVRVLAINQVLDPEDDKPALTDLRTAVLELEPEQAVAVAKAAEAGQLSLSLRSLAEGGDGGLADERPVLDPVFRRGSGALVVRYGFPGALTSR